MLEAIIASGILVTAIASSLTLTQSAISGEKDSETTIVAVNLAREAIEVVHGIRDSNWLEGSAFDDGLVGVGDDHVGAPYFDPALGAWTIGFAADDASSPEAVVYTYPSDAGPAVEGLMLQADVQPPGTVGTAFRRVVTLAPMCEDGLGGYEIKADGEGCGAAPKIGIQASATVTWSVSNRPKTEQAVVQLFDWR
jgi:hypothetical protein